MYFKKDGFYYFIPTTEPKTAPSQQQVKNCQKPRKNHFDNFISDSFSCVECYELDEEENNEIGLVFCTCYNFQVKFLKSLGLQNLYS